MTRAVIDRLRRMQGLGIVTSAQCVRAERYVERHIEAFSAATTVDEAVELALKSRALLLYVRATDTASPAPDAWQDSLRRNGR